MTWIDVALWTAFLLGIAAAAFIVGRRPAFWVEFATVMAAKLWPYIAAYVLKRMDAETEARWRECQRQGGKWNHRTKKCE